MRFERELNKNDIRSLDLAGKKGATNLLSAMQMDQFHPDLTKNSCVMVLPFAMVGTQ